MKISLVSDLHLEFCPLNLPGGDTLLLAGDITVADYLREKRTDKRATVIREETKRFFTEECGKYRRVFYIAGNHEHYHGIFEDTIGLLRQTTLTNPNIVVLNNEWTPLDENTVLFGGTMWTNYHNEDPIAMEVARRGMNDHYEIDHQNGDKFLPVNALAEFELTQKALQAALVQNPDKNFFVMTHHCPSFKSIHPKYGVDPLNYAFSSDLSEFILDNPRIKHWVHGHTHDSFKYAIGDCRVHCNPRGYARNPNIPPENAGWDPNYIIEV